MPPGKKGRRGPGLQKPGPRYSAVQTAAYLECKPAEVRQLARLLNVGKLARGRWWFTWAELETLRKYRYQKAD